MNNLLKKIYFFELRSISILVWCRWIITTLIAVASFITSMSPEITKNLSIETKNYVVEVLAFLYIVVELVYFIYDRKVKISNSIFNPDDILLQLFKSLELTEDEKLTFYTIVGERATLFAQSTFNNSMKVSKTNFPISHVEKVFDKRDYLYFKLNPNEADYQSSLNDKLGFSIDFIQKNKIESYTWIAIGYRVQSKEDGVLIIESKNEKFQYYDNGYIEVSEASDVERLYEHLQNNPIINLIRDSVR